MRVYIKEEELQYDGFVKIDKAHLKFERFNGKMSEMITRYRYHRGDAVAVIIYDASRERVLLIRQFRYAVHVRTGDGWLVECVAGMQEDGERVEDVARREVLEETGLELARIDLLAEYFFSPGGCSDKVYMFLGTVQNAEQSLGVHGLVDEGEDIQACWVHLREALKMVNKGQINDVKTMIGLFLLQNRIGLAQDKVVGGI